MQTIYSGRPIAFAGTLTGLRISSVNGTAFIDNAGAVIPTYADGNHSITIYDSSNRQLVGVLKAAGTGETTGTSVVDGWNFTSGWSWYGTAGTITDADTFVSGAVNGGLYKSGVIAAGTLYKSTLAGSTSGGIVTVRSFDGNSAYSMAALGESNNYHTAPVGTQAFVRCTAAGATVDISTMTILPVTAPSTAGATIVSAKSGATYNFISKDASFTYNSSSYYVVCRLLR